MTGGGGVWPERQHLEQNKATHSALAYLARLPLTVVFDQTDLTTLRSEMGNICENNKIYYIISPIFPMCILKFFYIKCTMSNYNNLE